MIKNLLGEQIILYVKKWIVYSVLQAQRTPQFSGSLWIVVHVLIILPESSMMDFEIKTVTNKSAINNIKRKNPALFCI